jgi:hypothetical protein
MTTDLECRLRAHYAELAASVAGLDEVADEPDRDSSEAHMIPLARPDRRASANHVLATYAERSLLDDLSSPKQVWPRVLAGLTAAAVIAFGITAITRPVSKSAPADSATVGSLSAKEMPLLLPTWLPKGYQIVSVEDSGVLPAIDPNLGPQDFSARHTAIYADDAVPPTRMLAVSTSSYQGEVGGVAGVIEIDGRVYETIDQPYASPSVQFRLPNGPLVVVMGKGFTTDELLRLAETAVARSSDPLDGVTISLPTGLRPIFDARPQEHRDSKVLAQRDSDHSIVVQQQIGRESIEELLVYRRDAFRPMTIRGHEAISFQDRVGAILTNSIVWYEAPGLMVSVTGDTTSEVINVAEGLAVVDFSNAGRFSTPQRSTVTTRLATPEEAAQVAGQPRVQDGVVVTTVAAVAREPQLGPATIATNPPVAATAAPFTVFGCDLANQAEVVAYLRSIGIPRFGVRTTDDCAVHVTSVVLTAEARASLSTRSYRVTFEVADALNRP